MRHRTELLAAVRERGFIVHATFVLPRSDWDAYYDPLRAAAVLTDEIEIHDRFGDEYGYVFFVASRS